MFPLPHVSIQGKPPVNRFTLTFQWIACSLLVLLGLGIYQSLQAAKKSLAPNPIHALSTSTPPKLVKGYGKLPLSFEANQGQTDGRVKFLSRGRGYALFLTGDEAVFTLEQKSSVSATQMPGVAPAFRSAGGGVAQHPRFGAAALPRPLLLPSLGMKDEWGQELEKPRDRRAGPALPSSSRSADSGERPTVLRMRLVGGHAQARVVALDELPGKVNYFIGNDPKKWRTNVSTYAKVKYQGVYPGIDLVYYGNQGGQLEYDFVVAPGADPSAIALDVAAGLPRHADVGAGLVPALEGHPRGVPLRLAADGDLIIPTGDGEVRFHRPMVYQPKAADGQRTTDNGPRTTVTSRFTLDAENRVRFALGPYDRSEPVVIDPVLVYSTYLGGSRWDHGYGIAVDASGNAYVTGITGSYDFPTANPLQANLGGVWDAFVAKLNAAGSALVYSTYLGGSSYDAASAIAVDSSGNAYVAGLTQSSDFPTVNPIQATNNSGNGGAYGTAFVAKLNAAGSALVYSTYLGGSTSDAGASIAVDSSRNAYVAGQTESSDFPTRKPLQAHLGGVGLNVLNAFVAKLNPAGSALVYSTYLGGSNYDQGNAIAVDSSGNAYVTGVTSSSDFPTANPLQAQLGGGQNAFVSKLNAAGSALVYSTYLGGNGVYGDSANAIAVDSSGNAYVAGETDSSDFPTANPLQAQLNATCYYCTNAFVTEMNTAGSALLYSTYLGGSIGYEGYSIGDSGNAIAVDSSGNAYVAGQANSLNFPTVNPLQANLRGPENAFVAKIAPAVVTLSPTSITFGSQRVGTTSAPETVTLTITGEGTLLISSIAASGDFAQTNNCGSSLANSSCTISVTFTPTSTGSRTGSITLTDNASVTPQTVPLSGTGINPAASLSPTSVAFGNELFNTASIVRNVFLTSSGTTNLVISSIAITGTNAADFSQTNTCTAASYAPGAKCTISVKFTPSILAAETASLVVTDNASNSPQVVPLTGTGVLPVELSPTSLSFGNLDEGVSSAAKTVTLTNYQKVTLTGISVSTTNSDYTQTNTCGTSIGVGKKCTVTVKFKPSIIGTDNATLSITDSASTSPQTVALTATGLAPVKLTPTSNTFVSENVGATSPAKVFTLTNYLSTTLSSIAISATGDFAVSSTTCTTTLAAKGKCTIDVVFKPTATGTRTGTLKVSDSAANSPQTSTLTGTGK